MTLVSFENEQDLKVKQRIVDRNFTDMQEEKTIKDFNSCDSLKPIEVVLNNIISLKINELNIDLIDSSFVKNLVNMKSREPIDQILILSSPMLGDVLCSLLEMLLPNIAITLVNDMKSVLLSTLVLTRQLENKKVFIYDVIKNTVGLGLYNGTIVPVIQARHQYPCIVTFDDCSPINYAKPNISVYEGQSCLTRNCRLIGEIVFGDLDRGCSMVFKLCCIIDANGVLQIKIFDSNSNNELKSDFNRKTPMLKYRQKRIDYDNYRDSDDDLELFVALKKLDGFIEFVHVLMTEMRHNHIVYDTELKIAQVKSYLLANQFEVTVEDCRSIRNELHKHLGMKHSSVSLKYNNHSHTFSPSSVTVFSNSFETKQMQCCGPKSIVCVIL